MKSNLSYIMNFLGIQNAAMANKLHVSPSLISKWKSGARPFNEKTSCFEDAIEYIIKESEKDDYIALREIMSEFFPSEDFSSAEKACEFLKIALSEEKISYNSLRSGADKTASAMIFSGAQGMREAVRKLLDYADSIPSPGEITFADMEEFRWLWEDRTFSQEFAKALVSLLKKGFHATFVICYSAERENFRNFFKFCSPVIFHKNTSWYYMQYYDTPIISLSFFQLRHGVSVMGMSSGNVSSAMLFQDSQLIMQQEEFVNRMIGKSAPLFEYFEPFDMPAVIESMPKFRKRGLFFNFLPVPAFISADAVTLKDILNRNNIRRDSEEYKNIMDLNLCSRKFSGVHYYDDDGEGENRTVFIFQIEKMVERIRKQSFVSSSLTLCCGREIIVYPEQYAAELRSLASILKSNSHIQIIFASEKDMDSLPDINCFCMQNNYILQMNSRGFRLCDESTVVSVASDALVRCMHKVPPERKDRSSVIKILLEMAESLENNHSKTL